MDLLQIILIAGAGAAGVLGLGLLIGSIIVRRLNECLERNGW